MALVDLALVDLALVDLALVDRVAKIVNAPRSKTNRSIRIYCFQ